MARPNNPKAGPGRGKVWEPSEDDKFTARFLAAGGATVEQIADYLGKGYKVVAERLAHEIKIGSELADLGLMGKLYRKAMGSGIHSTDGDTACLIYLGKVRLGLWDRPPLIPAHPNDSLPQRREELCVSVTYRYSNDPQALPPPPPTRLPQQIEATATKAD